MKRTFLLFALCLGLFTFNSCQKNEMAKVEEEASLSEQDALSETQVEETLSEIDLLVDEAININSSLLRSAAIDSASYVNDCPAITVDTESHPNVMTIDFGTSCTGKDGKIRSGKIIVTAQSFKLFPSARQKTFENFYVDGRKIEGTVGKTILRDSVNHVRTALVKEDVTITLPGGKGTIHRLTDMTRQYLHKVLKDKTDNQTVSWGTVELTRPSGVVVTKTIAQETPLVFSVACKQIISGIASFVNTKGRSWTIDYGNGVCDGKATLTENGTSKEIAIK